MKSKHYILSLVLVLISYTSSAQCAMCKAVVESGIDNGGLSAGGINTGILYLMFIPYALLSIFGFVLYKNYKKNKTS